MYLILHTKDRFQATWHIYANGQIKVSHKFTTEPGEENVLLNLDKFLRKQKVNLAKFKGFGLAVEESGLTQVKVLTTIINVLGWNYQRPIAGVFYEQDLLEKLVKTLAKTKKFKQIKAQYQTQPEITITKKKNKFKIVK